MLLVEGDEDAYVLVRDGLARAGAPIDVTWVASHQLGLELLRGGGHDVCLVDDRGDGRDGVDFVRAVHDLGVRTPVIVLASDPAADLDRLALQAGAADVVSLHEVDAHGLARALGHAVLRARTPGGEAASGLRDALTGLPGRGLLLDRLERAHARASRRRDGVFALLLLDLDLASSLDQPVGSTLADEALVEVARRLCYCVRDGDTVSRLDEDGFAVLLDDLADTADALRVGRRIQGALAGPVSTSHGTVELDSSIGIAVSATAYADVDALVRDAADSVGRARSLGGGRVELADDALRAHALGRLSLEEDLALAVERDELELRFHPVVAVATGEVAGFEALVRWRHPTRGVLAPLQFVPDAERTGTIVPIGRWVIRSAARQLAAWQREHPRPGTRPLTLSVNLSHRELVQHDLVDAVGSAIAESGVAPGSLQLEVAESSLVDPTGSTGRALAGLRGIGVPVAIDDFGAGNASLGDLFSLPFDSVKVDRSLVAGVDTDPTQLRTAVALARSLCPAVLAEGVETGGQASRLREVGCDLAQGFYFSDPLAADSASELVAAAVPAAAARADAEDAGVRTIAGEIARLAERLSGPLSRT